MTKKADFGRDAVIYAKRLAGQTYGQIGRRYGLSKQRVAQIVAAQKKHCMALQYRISAATQTETGGESERN
jgi:methylaspartate ammonia-lyase